MKRARIITIAIRASTNDKRRTWDPRVGRAPDRPRRDSVETLANPYDIIIIISAVVSQRIRRPTRAYVIIYNNANCCCWIRILRSTAMQRYYNWRLLLLLLVFHYIIINAWVYTEFQTINRTRPYRIYLILRSSCNRVFGVFAIRLTITCSMTQYRDITMLRI